MSMERVAVFVDAGYLYAQGSVALTGSKKSRTTLNLNESIAVREIIAHATTIATTNTRLLRVYWYDGAVGARQTLEQQRIADMADVKMRLGIVNSVGEQKGVDSLIVTDLVELARTQAISDAVLLAGDEDLRIGVEIAQRYGVRVHLLGIEPSRGSQSILLIRESDTTAEWDAAKIGAFLTYTAPAAPVAPVPVGPPIVVTATPTSVAASPAVAAAGAPSATPAGVVDLQSVVDTVAATVAPADARQIVDDWDNRLGLDRATDGKFLASARTAFGRDLERDEIRSLRRMAVDALRIRASS